MRDRSTRILFLAVLSILPACGGGSSSQQTSGELLALSYNVAGLPQGLSGSNPERFTPLIAPLLNGYDLVLLQESWQTPEVNPYAPLRVYHEILAAGSTHPYKSIPATNPFNTDPRRPEAALGDGLNRFSIFPFEPVIRQAWEGCDNSAADCLAFKGFSVARTTLAEGVTVDVYNLHMEAGGTPRDEELRDEGVSQLRDFILEFSAGRAVIVGGDFNLHTDEEPDSSQFQRLLAEAGLTDVCAALDCPQPGRIDKFLFRSSDSIEIAPTSWRFETDVFVSPEGEALSDHDALAVRFTWSASD
jgi:endonuclease/exonuclease/phosphatase family metal-dependent hydrolase